ncbi:AAC(3) family N-acetyltransferase [Rubripirellula reticaptiva]|uniref:Aminoglycoside N(3)-acetyltransferase n=1 Tax=Rubripirellula reticaptiva TaxID=2528013 RepID=A0A5C6F2Z7_9BACT|nr:AAC(3) family N-acetyltransferase [Rubripirellula reticaptiva]TWU55688.1 SPBc2 prophage-derived aminoglycoside N(3')-acetyltransferase-like protein YokD [Rubripirellula reticaptiva]
MTIAASLSFRHRLKKTLKSAHRYLAQPHLTHQKMYDHFEDLGLRRGGMVLVHSSLSSLGYCAGGSAMVIDSLLSYIGESGTLVMPTHTWSAVNNGKRSFSLPNDATHVGSIPETFRKMPNVSRSNHPSHSVASSGPLSNKLIEDHVRAESPCGEGTPYARLMEGDGQILLLGVELRRNTCFHSVEAMAKVPYLLRPDKDRFKIELASDDTRYFDVRCHQPALPSRFHEFQEPLKIAGCLRTARIGNGESIVIDAKQFLNFMMPLLSEDSDLLLVRSETPFDVLMEYARNFKSTLNENLMPQ